MQFFCNFAKKILRAFDFENIFNYVHAYCRIIHFYEQCGLAVIDPISSIVIIQNRPNYAIPYP